MVEVDKINELRLESWKQKMNEHHATGVILIGIGHDHVSGQIHMCVLEDFTTDQIKELLWQLYHSIK